MNHLKIGGTVSPPPFRPQENSKALQSMFQDREKDPNNKHVSIDLPDDQLVNVDSFDSITNQHYVLSNEDSRENQREFSTLNAVSPLRHQPTHLSETLKRKGKERW